MSRHPGGARTTVTITWVPFDATDAELQTFEKGRESMKMGWTGTFERFEEYLKKT